MRAGQDAVHARASRAAVVIAALTLLSACATGRNDNGAGTAPHTVAGTSVPAPVRGAGIGMDNTLRGSPKAARRPVPAAASKTPCKIKGDSVAWVHLSGHCQNGYAHGQGRAESVDGLRHYSGGFTAGNFDGEGSYDWGNGVHYAGRFVRGAKTGRGTIVYPDNRKYAGEFKGNLYHGAGRYTEADGSVYDGAFSAGRFHGRGIYVWANGDKYTGQFRDDLMDGDGVYLRANGETYAGQFSKNERNGAGTYQWPGGDRYVGAFRDNEINGEGTYHHADGTKYVGQFLNGKKHGWGRLIAATGEFRQHWEQGQKIGEEKVPPQSKAVRLDS
jgi:hypothetical protein